MVREIRSVAPGMGAYKLFLILKDIFGENMPGRDRFYDLMHRRHLMLPVVKCRHTTNSNHPYRKYKNLIKGFVPTAPDQLWVADITYIDTDCGVLPAFANRRLYTRNHWVCPLGHSYGEPHY